MSWLYQPLLPAAALGDAPAGDTMVAINAYVPPTVYAGQAFMNSGLIDATGEKLAFVGTVSWADKTVSSRAIRNVSFLPGALTTAGGSGLTLSLQDIDLANGPIFRPDGTADQTVSFLASAMTANTFYTTPNLSADRTVSLGDLLCVVLEFDGAGRLGSDAVNVIHSTLNPYDRGGQIFFNGTTWSNLGANGCVFTFADGAVGILAPSFPVSTNASAFNYSSASTPDEHALRFTPPYTCKIDALWASAAPSSGAANLDFVLYSGTTALVTASVDANTARSTNTLLLEVPIAETTLTGGATYRIAVKPTTTTNVSLRYYEVASSAIRACLPEATTCGYSSRTDAGSWTDNDLRIPLIGVRLSSIEPPSGGGGIVGHGLISTPLLGV